MSNRSVPKSIPFNSIHNQGLTVCKSTGYKSLYINPERITHFEGLRHEESEYLLKFLSDHITKGADFHARYKWSEGDICVWDQVSQNCPNLLVLGPSVLTKCKARVHSFGHFG